MSRNGRDVACDASAAWSGPQVKAYCGLPGEAAYQGEGRHRGEGRYRSHCPDRGGFTTVPKNSSIRRTTLMNYSKSTGLET